MIAKNLKTTIENLSIAERRSVGDIFLNEVIDIVEEAFKRNKIVYANSSTYGQPREGACLAS